MNAEFTGERVIPGQVDVDLWNEHFARYAFASRLARGKRVLDAGCGTGYGSAELATVARSVTAIDVSAEALAFAGASYESPKYAQASCTDLPFADGSFDLVVMFEVIEHLVEWPRALLEARRVLARDGQLIVSTPNKQFYTESRGDSGANPYHEHEFEYGEFRGAVSEVFPHVTMFFEDHTESVIFRPEENNRISEARVETSPAPAQDASFFIAICGNTQRDTPATFVFVPRSANMLREKLLHIRRLEDEVQTKDRWIAYEQGEHQELLRQHTIQLAELEKSNRWAAELDTELNAARNLIASLYDQMNAARVETENKLEACERQVLQLKAELEDRDRRTLEAEEGFRACAADRDFQTAELTKCVAMLHETEATLEERTRWAMSLNEQREHLEAMVGAVRASRWIRLGRVLGLGPELPQH